MPSCVFLHAVIAASALLAACATPVDDQPAIVRIFALPPVVHPADNPPSPAKVALGAQLFVDKRLSGSGNTACQGCHYRHLGWTDGLQLSRRDDGALNTRHTPTLYNVGHQTLWYWDGRAATLEGQILAAWCAQSGADPVKVAALLNGIPGYAAQFQAVFGALATPDSVALSAPYFHDGSRATLQKAVRYMVAGGGDDPKKSPLLVPTGLTEAEIAKIVEFLKALTSTEPWTATALP